jgi:hypothetical protein
MKEVVLPVSGDFARIERVKSSDLMATISAPVLVIALIERLVTVDGRKVDAMFLDSMALSDAFVIAKIISAEIEPAGIATGVA